MTHKNVTVLEVPKTKMMQRHKYF